MARIWGGKDSRRWIRHRESYIKKNVNRVKTQGEYWPWLAVTDRSDKDLKIGRCGRCDDGMMSRCASCRSWKWLCPKKHTDNMNTGRQ